MWYEYESIVPRNSRRREKKKKKIKGKHLWKAWLNLTAHNEITLLVFTAFHGVICYISRSYTKILHISQVTPYVHWILGVKTKTELTTTKKIKK